MAPPKVEIVEDGQNGTLESENFNASRRAEPYQVLNQYHSQPSKIRVACVGAGASGRANALNEISIYN
jgi:predicted kinase